jgi:hypothetical protein
MQNVTVDSVLLSMQETYESFHGFMKEETIG